MSLPRLRLEKCINEGGIWQIDAEQAHHLINVRRCCNGSLVEGLFEGEKVELKILCKGDSVYAEEISRETEAPLFPELHLMLALLKSEQFDDALRFAAETGVRTIHLLDCERGVPKYNAEKLEEKMSRWRKILDEATKQAGSAKPPELRAPLRVDEIDQIDLPQNRFVALISPDAHELKSIDYASPVAVAIGPEGDWSPAEIQKLLSDQFIPVSLGRRILRASTAVAVACGWFMLR